MHLLHVSVVLYTLNTLLGAVHGHAYLANPPGRSSLWRFGFDDAPSNYDDMEQNCGGFLRQKYLGWKCGICGDPYDQPAPRNNEAGGKYAKGIISKNYTIGSTIDITVRITANHLGFFEFRLCENNDVTKTITKECLKHLLVNPQTGETKHHCGDKEGDIVTRVKLPENVTCSQCVLQWRYHTENKWGTDDRGYCLGCGPQEEFYGCSDIAILSSGVTNEASTPETSTLRTTSSKASATKTTTAPTETTTGTTKKTTAPTELTTGTTKTTTTPTETTTGTTKTTFAPTETTTGTTKTTTTPTETTTGTTRTTTAPTKSTTGTTQAITAPIETTTGTTKQSTTAPTNKRPCVSTANNVEDEWCNINCNHVPSFCPPNLCHCI